MPFLVGKKEESAALLRGDKYLLGVFDDTEQWEQLTQVKAQEGVASLLAKLNLSGEGPFVCIRRVPMLLAQAVIDANCLLDGPQFDDLILDITDPLFGRS